MRRTYRSKKEIGGGIDHRDLLSTVDTTSSVFDAFYIQNIKQTKREISCVGSSNQSNVASYKVRKRKYVKRIVKDISLRNETLDTISQSAYLTPDKSLHVNRAPDPFDLLLNSSPVVNESPALPHRIPKKTYGEKKTTRIRKLYCSSNENNDSDKENSKTEHNGTSPNTSDVKCHKLLIEKENVISPKCNDESICNIVKRIPFLKSIDRSTRHNSFKINHRLTSTMNLKSPAKNSPLSSTPFQEKYRSKSIYNFSPISLDLADSPNVSVNNSNENNNAISFNDDNPKDNSMEIIKHTKPLLVQSSLSKGDSCNLNSLHITPIENKNVEEQHIIAQKKIPESSSLLTSEIEPFLGFAVTSIAADKVYMDKEQYKENNLEFHNVQPPELSRKYTSNNLSTEENDKVTNTTSGSTSLNKFNKMDNSNEDENASVIVNSSIEDQSTVSEKGIVCTKFISNTEKSDRVSLKYDITDTESFYDTCNSDESSIDNDNPVYVPKPLVMLERMNSSLFYKYYNKMPKTNVQSEDEEELLENNGDCNDYSSLGSENKSAHLSNKSYNTDFSTDANDNSRHDFSDEEKVSLDSDHEFDMNKSEEEDRCISFVTTRRRNEITNDSIIFICDNSYGSSSSLDTDRTIVSNKNNHSSEKCVEKKTPTKQFIERDTSNNNLSRKSVDVRQTLALENSNKNNNSEPINIDLENVSMPTATISTCKKEGDISQIDGEFGNEIKPPIVLQPGKKWERSLSIYKRMTTIADTFDHSVLDDEPLKCKGRKYRQSVISTMEMQKFPGSLHNESMNGRRSTFIFKPTRTTMKIVKENRNSRASLCSTTVYDDLKGFLSDDCDDTIVELSKLSIGDSEHEVTVLENFHDTSRIATARDYVLRRCNQTEAILFDECYPDTELKNCHKIGEGVYGEVFLWRAHDGRARVLKIIPIAGDIKVNGEPQKGYHEIISEIVIAMELSALRAPIPEIEKRLDEGKEIDALDLHSVENATDIFNEVLAVRCVYGSYPSRLLDLWDLYDECKGSENDNPAILPPDQHFIVLELANAGQDLESYQFNSAEQAYSLFLQVAFGLAVAEEAFQFEHRDLHWGNVLISSTEQKYATFVLRGRTRRVPRRGVAATVIDYSLSRLSLRGGALYSDLAADEALFEAVGDRQFTVYRLMRDRLENDWKNFDPYTNILWLDYVVDKMITSLRYKRTNTKIHKHYIAKLKAIKNRILDYGSAALFVLTDNEF